MKNIALKIRLRIYLHKIIFYATAMEPVSDIVYTPTMLTPRNSIEYIISFSSLIRYLLFIYTCKSVVNIKRYPLPTLPIIAYRSEVAWPPPFLSIFYTFTYILMHATSRDFRLGSDIFFFSRANYFNIRR